MTKRIIDGYRKLEEEPITGIWLITDDSDITKCTCFIKVNCKDEKITKNISMYITTVIVQAGKISGYTQTSKSGGGRRY